MRHRNTIDLTDQSRIIWSYLHEELRPVPQAVWENRSVKGLDAFLIEPALAAAVVLGQLLKVRPPGHLDRRENRRERAKESTEGHRLTTGWDVSWSGYVRSWRGRRPSGPRSWWKNEPVEAEQDESLDNQPAPNTAACEQGSQPLRHFLKHQI